LVDIYNYQLNFEITMVIIITASYLLYNKIMKTNIEENNKELQETIKNLEETKKDLEETNKELKTTNKNIEHINKKLEYINKNLNIRIKQLTNENDLRSSQANL